MTVLTEINSDAAKEVVTIKNEILEVLNNGTTT